MCLIILELTLTHMNLYCIEDYGVFLKGGTVLNYDITPSYSLDIECGDHRRKVADVLTVDLIRNEVCNFLSLLKLD